METAADNGGEPKDQPGDGEAQRGRPDGQTRTQRLMEQYTEIASLAGGLAHEIKNPLSTIRLNLELLAEDLQGSDAPHDRRALSKIHVIQRECRHLQEILEDFLRFARVNELHCNTVDLNAAVEEFIEFYAPEFARNKIEVSPYLAADLPPVALDQHLFQRMLLNLVLNAQQSMPEGGQLTLQTYGDGKWVKLDLIDTGCGMSAQTIKDAFRVFYSTKRDGNGLGLPTARKIIEAHQGTITVQSEVSKGTRFTISLPVFTPEAQSGKTMDVSTLANRGGVEHFLQSRHRGRPTGPAL